MIYIQTEEELKKNIHILDSNSVLGTDVETTSLDPLTGELRLLQIGTSEETLVIDCFKIRKEIVAKYVRPYLESLEIVKILHNAKFDVKWVKHHLGIDIERIFDSYLASLLIEAGLGKPKGYHKLEQVVKRYLDKDMDKTEQMSNWGGELSMRQIEYAAYDVSVLFPLREAMIPVLKEMGLIRVAKLEFEAVLPTAWLELCGFYLDIDQWMKVAEDNLAKSYIIADEIYKDLEPVLTQGTLFGEATINLDSHQQIQKYFRLLGVPMPDSTREFYLTPLQDEYQIVKKLLEYRGCKKAFTSFGEKYKQYVHPRTGRIHADFMALRSETGRYGTAGPNLAQIPSDKYHRNCFRAEEGNSLICNDFSQEELRILADFSGDKKFIALFHSGADFHQATASEVFGVPVEAVTKDQRTFAKRLNFGVVYGIGAAKFSMTAGIPLSEAETIIKAYFEKFKTVKRWLNYQKYQVLQTGYSRSGSGRMTKYEWNEATQYKAQLNACNMPMQATGADILKRALRIFYDTSKHFHHRIKLVNIVHDEIIVEAPDDIVQEVAEMLRDCMVTAGEEYIQAVPVRADISVMKVWNKE